MFNVATKKEEVKDMRGRPKKENTRDIVYKVRLNAEEDQMLTYASEWTGQAKSEVFRKALHDYFRSVEISEHISNKEKGEVGWSIDHISQQRLIKCPYTDCDEEFVVDFSEYSDEQELNGSMGNRCEHIFDTYDIECPECHRHLHVAGVISEYPVGAFEYEQINVEKGVIKDE